MLPQLVGPVLLTLGSSLAFYERWPVAPEHARRVNRHALIAIALNTCANIALVLLVRR